MIFRRFLCNRSGATAIEFAFTAPVFLALVGGIIEIGLLLYTQVALQHGVEAGARCGSINTNLCATASQVKTYAAQQTLGISVPVSAFTVTTPSCGTQVQATSTFPFVFTNIGLPTMTLTASSCFPK